MRLKGKHVSGEAWYSFNTKTWYFLTDPEGKHSHLMDRLNTQLRQESIRKLKEHLKVLESRHSIAQKKIAEHRAAKEAIASEMQALNERIGELESGAPLESGTDLEYSRHIKRQ